MIGRLLALVLPRLGGGGGGGGGLMDMLKGLMGGMGGGGGGGSKGGGGGGGGGGMGGGWASAWQDPGSGAGPNLIGGPPPVNYNPPAPFQPGPATATPPSAAPMSETMRPRQNAGGDFWGPVVMRLIKRYRAQQMGGGGGFDELGMGGSSTVPLGSGLEER